MPAPQPRIELACALPKGGRQSILLEMATQLGINVFWPLQCERSSVKPGATASRRWQRICVEACKQSRQGWLLFSDIGLCVPGVIGCGPRASRSSSVRSGHRR
ncbi:MAG: 16S rRNA (uracil(1498)-N(3))-methyltransferase [Acidiferrobacterales bacterium]